MKAIRRRWQCNAVVCYTLSRGCLGALSIMGRKLPGCPTSRMLSQSLSDVSHSVTSVSDSWHCHWLRLTLSVKVSVSLTLILTDSRWLIHWLRLWLWLNESVSVTGRVTVINRVSLTVTLSVNVSAIGSFRVRSTNFLLNLRDPTPISMKFGTLGDYA